MSLPLVAALSLLGLTSACQETATAPGSIDREVVLAPGERAEIEPASIQIRFEGVASDSRCPVDVNCIQAGDAVVQITVTGEDTATYELHTQSPQSVRHGDLTIALVQLQPQPVSGQPIAPEDYRATIRVTR